MVAEVKSRGKSAEKNQPPQFTIEKKIHVPAEIYAWKASDTDRGKAAEVQKRNREEFIAAFRAGLAVLSYERDSQGNGTFLLGRDQFQSYASAGGEQGNHED